MRSAAHIRAALVKWIRKRSCHKIYLLIIIQKYLKNTTLPEMIGSTVRKYEREK